MLEQIPALRDHLHQPLADRPVDRPDTRELLGWVERLADLVRHSGIPDAGIDWGEPETQRVVGRAKARPPVAGTETDAFQRIEKLERELVELRAAVGTADGPRARASVAAASAAPAATRLAAANGSVSPTRLANGGGHPPEGRPRVPDSATGEQRLVANARPVSGAPAPVGSPNAQSQIRGRAAVPAPKRVDPTESVVRPGDSSPGWQPRPKEDPRILKRGWELSGIGAFFAFICWGIWAASTKGRLATPLFAFFLVLVVAAGVFAVSRLVGRIVLVQRMGRTRRSAKGAHAITGLFLAAAGFAYLEQTQWVVEFFNWARGVR
jgi:hypothetical protein